jgi:hypothetical protein
MTQKYADSVYDLQICRFFIINDINTNQLPVLMTRICFNHQVSDKV